MYPVNIKLSPKCGCNSPFEDAIHFLLECQLCWNERTQPFSRSSETDCDIEILLFSKEIMIMQQTLENLTKFGLL